MKDFTIISCVNDTDKYLSFVPTVAKMWNNITNKKMVLGFITNRDENDSYILKLKEIVDLKIFRPINGIPTNNQAKVTRMYLVMLTIGKTMIVDIDMYVLNNKVIGTEKDETKSGNGIHIWKAREMHIENNEVRNMRDGIYLEYVQKSKITNNKSIDNIRYGLHFMFSHDNVYDYNEFKGNGAGVAVMYSKRVEMYHNKFHHNWGTASYGLLLKEIYDSKIENNIFEDNTIGINLDGCNRITYSKNTFIGNGWALKFIGACYTNKFEKNNFLSNAFDLSYSSKLNDNSFNGNHWSDYTGYDLDNNGVGDVPFRPVKLFSYIVNKSPDALVLLRSLFVDVLNFSEKVSPVFTPDKLVDSKPIMKTIELDD